MTQHEAHVTGVWWTSAAGWLLSVWSWLTHGMSPLAAALTLATLVLTILKIAQEIRAWRKDSEERTALQKLVDRLTRKSSFDKLDSKP